MADLEYNVHELHELGTSLVGLAARLGDDGGLMRVGLDDVAHRDVVDALRDFAGDWDDRRERLARSVATVGELGTNASDSFSRTDDELGDRVRAVVEHLSHTPPLV